MSTQPGDAAQHGRAGEEQVDLATYGEALLSFTAVEPGPLHSTRTFVKDVAGSEVNVAIAMRRLGHCSAFVGALGDDEAGDDVIRTFGAEGVDAKLVQRLPGETGIYLKTRSALDRLSVSYRRSTSVASRDTPDRFDLRLAAQARIVHLTGISALVSDGGRRVLETLMDEAHDQGALVSFDVNLRKALLRGRDVRELMLPLAARADLLFLSGSEASTVLGAQDLVTLRHAWETLGLQALIVHDEYESVAVTADGLDKVATFHRRPVDVVGAGDAFVAGYLSGVVRGSSSVDRLALGNACGSCAVSVRGDASSMPWAIDVQDLLAGVDLDAR